MFHHAVLAPNRPEGTCPPGSSSFRMWWASSDLPQIYHPGKPRELKKPHHGPQPSEGGYAALAVLYLDADFSGSSIFLPRRVVFPVDFLLCSGHNNRTSLVKVCVLNNTTLTLFYEQSRGVFYFSSCGFRITAATNSSGGSACLPWAGPTGGPFFPCSGPVAAS